MGNNDGMAGKKMYAMVTNTGAKGELGKEHIKQMDIMLPGGGEGRMHGCSAGLFPNHGGAEAGRYKVNGQLQDVQMENEPAVHNLSLRGISDTWGLEYGGIQSLDACSKLPAPFQEACRIKHEWGGGKLGELNKTWIKPMDKCPAALERRVFGSG